MQCNVMLCNVMLCYAMQCNAMQNNAMYRTNKSMALGFASNWDIPPSYGQKKTGT